MFNDPKLISLPCLLSLSKIKHFFSSSSSSSPQRIELSLVSALKSCSFPLGQQLHGFALKSGLDRFNLFVRNGLINLYAKCGFFEAARYLFRSSSALDTASWNIMLVNCVKSHRFDDALILFDEMPKRDCVSFTTMIMGLAQNGGFGQEALSLFRDMVSEGVKPNEVTLATLLSSCSRLYQDMRCDHLVVAGKMVHTVAVKTGLDVYVLVGTNLVNWYGVTSNLEHSRAVFDEMTEKNTVTWNAMLNGYAKAGLIDLAIDLFERISVKDLVSWSTMIDSYLRVGMLEKALFGYREMMKQDQNARPNEVMLVDLVSGCSRCNALREGSQLHTVIIKAGLDCHSFMKATLIHFYAECKKVDLACMVFENPCRMQTIACWNSLLAGFVTNGMLDSARNLFQEMPERDVVSWSSMISGYVQFDRSDLALELSHDMMRYGVKPNEITLVSVLSAVASCGTLNQGKSVHNYVVKNNSISLSDNLIAALIDMYAKRGSINNAVRLFSYHYQNAASLSTASPWNALICGLAMHGHADTCLGIFSSMQKRKDVKPNAITFIGVLSACCHAGMVSAGREYFKSMSVVYGIEPSIKHYGCMVDLLGRTGCLDEAERLVMDMPMKADVVIWGSMLAAAKTHGNVEIGERAAKRLARIDSSHGGGRVLLSNIYADARRWDDVFVVRSGMQQERLVKVPASSGIL